MNYLCGWTETYGTSCSRAVRTQTQPLPHAAALGSLWSLIISREERSILQIRAYVTSTTPVQKEHFYVEMLQCPNIDREKKERVASF